MWNPQFLRTICLACAVLLLAVTGVSAQELPPCGERPAFLVDPWVDGELGCLEQVIHDDSYGVLGFSALATDADGALYATRPLQGEVYAFDDTNGDLLPDTPRLVADGLTLPNGMTYHDGALLITGSNHLYRLPTTPDAEIEVLFDDLPAGITGFWTGDVVVEDDWIYLTAGAPCDFCLTADSERGAVWRFSTDGEARERIARGLRYPDGLAWHNGALWTVDTARDDLRDMPNLDELNRVEGEGEHFGFPFCIGADNLRDPDLDPRITGLDCATAVAPVLTFPTHSTPLALASYESDTLPLLTGSLLVVLYGPYNEADLYGYALAAVRFDETGVPAGYDIVIPSDVNPERGFSLEALNYRRSGFWPTRPLDVTVDPNGWVYISVTGGRIYALRPHTQR